MPSNINFKRLHLITFNSLLMRDPKRCHSQFIGVVCSPHVYMETRKVEMNLYMGSTVSFSMLGEKKVS